MYGTYGEKPELEAKVKRKIDRWIARNLPDAYVYKPGGGPWGVAGTPDYFICWLGIFIAIEVKREGMDPRPNQWAALRSIKAAGGIAAVIRGDQLNRLPTIKLEVLKRVQHSQLQLAHDGGTNSLHPSEAHR
jgi:hypothetical protein